MRVVEITAFGGPEVLAMRQRPVPVPEPDEVLIKVAAAGVNRPDLMQRMGMYPPPPGASDIPGLEVAGEVVAVGTLAGSLRVGDKVCALVAGGGYAEYCVAPAIQCLPVPEGLDLVEAASLPETFFTVWTNVFEQGRLLAGETFLVHGGSSGIGVTAIQLARRFGARVIATAGSLAKCRACEALGATAINYREADFVEVVGEITQGQGVDVILDMVGGDYLQRNLACLAEEGRLLQIGLQAGAKAQINLLPVLLKRLTLTGSTLRRRSVAEKGRIAAALREKVWPLLAQGKLRPVIDRSFELDAAAEAHRYLESGAHIGKIVLTVN
ncbi:NAD(P)H-quinone oxidoreductase [Methyloterricola oryzae]|uniref:NAD(P)H-quinone oxidoreductase n=1 Tax=Methyloterricola oryzae TaxID=1495050 RepID=UPI0005EAD136|nr:NAD(P)H-quinone oxidoreductase [Methyloterricola oryzae]